MKNFCVILFALSFLLSCSFAQSFKSEQLASQKVSHNIWDNLLAKHVSVAGKVSYKSFIADSLKLNSYLAILSKGAPNPKTWTEEEQIAYWINAYNAFTVQLMIRNYPLQSIKDVGGKIPFINSTWDIKFIEIAGEKMDLNNIEHGILRKDFNEPRIHFAVNCASISCPKLRNEAYTGDKLNAQLTDQAKFFLNKEKGKNDIRSKDAAELSKLFKWFKGDFTNGNSLVEFINKYSDIKLTEKATITYKEYNWNLNE